ncbi:transporter substrate-binding domain-containing protein [Pseudomonas sp. LS44]|uniref:substrate-binding periplasmic protein n=1 Tax=Pseudomonas sp. LS44 TaxID=1357074 RepID=UPI00215AB8B9|nr:transporter substrate-binding domain-containing protein [Pseudomonas sp. LS44]UVE18889.1 transporter substrate-binding domain-containing protein [Pseudomonas sp. LS44]
MSRFSGLAALLALLWCVPAANAAEPLRLVSLEYPPYSSAKIPGGGSIVELVTQAMASQGKSVHIDFMPWARARAELRSHRYAGALPLWPREIVEEQLIASRPLFYSELGFFVRRDTPVQFTTLNQLKGHRVGIVRGYGYPQTLLHSGFRSEEAVDDLSNLRKLAARRFDLVLLERVVGEHLIASHATLRGQLIWQGRSLERTPLLVGFLPQRPGEPDWAATFERGLRELHATGDYMRIIRKHNSIAVPQ